MKVGDLVTLSTYGFRVKRNGWVDKGDVGIVKEIVLSGNWSGYTVHWMRSNYHDRRRGAFSNAFQTRGSSWDWERRSSRKDLKFVKKKRG